MSDSGGASRRALLLGAGAVGAASVLAACGDEPDGSQPPGPGNPGGGSSQNETVEVKPAAGIPIAFVPVGSGYIDFAQGVIVTQPEAGQFRAFDANCTHMRCNITWVADGLIRCPCHGSQFRISDGSVVTGPATRPLDGRSVTVDGDVLVVS